MSKYNALWDYIQQRDESALKLTFAEIEEAAGIPIDHSFLRFKKELLDYGFEVVKISRKEENVLFRRMKEETE